MSYYDFIKFNKYLSGQNGRNIFAVIGNPVSHSMSPLLHSLIEGDCEYSAVHIKNLKELKSFCTVAKTSLKGFNVTIPYKKTVIKYLDGIDQKAQNTGSVNTVSVSEGKLIGYNTDVYGIMRTLENNNIKIKGKTAVVLGGGGAACAAVEALKGAQITLAVRNTKKISSIKGVNVVDINKIEGKYDILINCTPCGMKGQEDTSAIDITEKNYGVVFDMVYNPLKTKLLKQAQNTGIATISGIDMLIHQGIKSRQIWKNINIEDIDTDKIKNLLKARILQDRLGGKCIALCGFMGSGKSSIAKHLYCKYSIKYIDTDSLITSHTGNSINKIFADYGEQYFRRIESEIIKNIDFSDFKVISLGGGAVEIDSNIQVLKSNCIIIYVEAKLSTVLERISDNTRPLLCQDTDKIKELYQKRKVLYKNVCDIAVSGEKSLSDICEDIISI